MRTLGPYQLLRKVGSGGMAEVWSARRVSRVAGDKFVAVKILAHHLTEDARYREMFIGEAKLSLVLNHANIVTVFDVVEDDGECYMVMELVEGMTLSQLIRGLAKRGEKLPLEVSVYVVAELLRALAYAHGVKTEIGSTIVHRDVSPQNVMVSTSGEVKLMDFGIARFSTEETSGNLVKGKLQYMPPEQLARRTREPTIDLFAVGGVLQELLEGRRFRGGIDQEVLLGMVIRGETPELTVEIPEELDRVRRQLLEPDSNLRLSTAKQALSQIYQWQGFRNASLQLEEFVCDFVEPSSATSLPIPMLEGQDAEYEENSDIRESPTGADATPEPDPRSEPDPGPKLDAGPEEEVDSEVDVGAQPDATDGGHDDDHEAKTEIELATYAELPLEADEPFDAFVLPSPGRRVAAIVGAVLLASIFLVMWRSGVFSSEPELAEVDAQTSPPKTETIAAADPVPAATEGTAGDLSADTGETEGTDAGDEDELATSGKKKKAVKPKVSVEFVASDFYFVYIKVGGRILTLEPKTRLRLPIGTHTVHLKQKSSDSWKKAGVIRLKKGSSYRVEMKKPAGLRQSKK